jgi:hypothetical protein
MKRWIYEIRITTRRRKWVHGVVGDVFDALRARMGVHSSYGSIHVAEGRFSRPLQQFTCCSGGQLCVQLDSPAPGLTTDAQTSNKHVEKHMHDSRVLPYNHRYVVPACFVLVSPAPRKHGPENKLHRSRGRQAPAAPPPPRSEVEQTPARAVITPHGTMDYPPIGVGGNRVFAAGVSCELKLELLELWILRYER